MEKIMILEAVSPLNGKDYDFRGGITAEGKELP